MVGPLAPRAAMTRDFDEAATSLSVGDDAPSAAPPAQR